MTINNDVLNVFIHYSSTILSRFTSSFDSINDDVTPSQTQSTITLHRDGKYEDTLKYDPFQHRNVAHPTSTLGSFCHLLKSSLGSGLFAMPAAFKHAGLIPGCLGSFLVGFIATHCVHILVSCTFIHSRAI
ncbi:unnamed protein product [Plutella xylostella]|uniref:(diamondback moth) hypothetical protein n=1 Tax=Plutella xylostella TaxID=51655 RepID=A0A8S4G2G1_PLUXY|nr:unnamed protein product [Plutella xylostella]